MDLGGSQRWTWVGLRDGTGWDSEPGGRALEPAGRAWEPAVRVSEPVGRGSDPAGRASDPAGRASEPAGKASEPAGRPREGGTEKERKKVCGDTIGHRPLPGGCPKVNQGLFFFF